MRVLPIDDRRLEPFEQGRIRLSKEIQRFANVPSTEVNSIFDGVFYDIAFFR